jgi:hypothetical protein
LEDVGPGTPDTEIGVHPTIEEVVATLAEEGIVAGSTADVVIADPAFEPIVARAADKQIVLV